MSKIALRLKYSHPCAVGGGFRTIKVHLAMVKLRQKARGLPLQMVEKQMLDYLKVTLHLMETLAISPLISLIL